MVVMITLESKAVVSNLLKSFHSLYQSGHLCDVTVQTQLGDSQGSFPLHKAVLVACSSYFWKMFISGDSSSSQSPTVILQNTSTDDFAAFVEFIYTAVVEVTHDQLPRLVEVANKLECKELLEACKYSKVTAPCSGTKHFDHQHKGYSNTNCVFGGRTTSIDNISNMDCRECENGQSETRSSQSLNSFKHVTKSQEDESNLISNEAPMNGLETKMVIRKLCIEEIYDRTKGSQSGKPKAKRTHKWCNETFKCEKCPKEFKRLNIFESHMAEVHEVKGLLKYSCDMCPQLVSSQKGLHQHQMAFHTCKRPLACKTCGKRFKSAKDISDHQRKVHGKNNPEVCPFCDKLISSKAGLVIHIRTHTGEKPYKCKDCDACFAQKLAYNAHIRKIHRTEKITASRKPVCWTHINPNGNHVTDHTTTGTEKTFDETDDKMGLLGMRDGKKYIEKSNVRTVADNMMETSVGARSEALGYKPCNLGVKSCAGNRKESGKKGNQLIPEEDEETVESDKKYSGYNNQEENASILESEQPSSFKYSFIGEVMQKESRRKLIPEATVLKLNERYLFKCDKCSGQFHTRQVFVSHYQEVHQALPEKLYECEMCGKTFSNLHTWREHRVCVHSDERKFACNVCGGTFKRQRDVRTHFVRKHEGRVKRPLCSVCGKMLSSQTALVFHMRTHTGEKPYQCTVCNGRFAQPSQLKIHIRGHTGEKPYICEVCGASFGDSGKLTSHRRTHTGQRLFKCDMCEKSFTSKEYLKRHKICHLGVKPFKCDICGKAFGLRASYFQHSRVHSDTRPFFCEQCGKSFTQPGALRRHQRIHTGEKPFKCKACERTFTDMSTLRRHVAVHDKKAQWRTYVIDLTNKKKHNWSKIKILGDEGSGNIVSRPSAGSTQETWQKRE